MLAHQALRALVLVIILTIGSVLPALMIPPVAAQESQQNTTLYFSNYLGSFTGDNLLNASFIPLSVNPPTNQFDSQYPPNFLPKNSSFPLFKPKQWSSWLANNSGQWPWGLWLLTAFVLQGINFSDYLDNYSLGGYDFTILLPTPNRVIEGYTYNGDNSITVSGDLTFHLFFSPPPLRDRGPKYQDNVTVGLYVINANALFPLPKFITNTSVRLTPKLFSGIYEQQMTLPHDNIILRPGDSLLVSVEIKPTEKPKIIQKPFVKVLYNIVNAWEKTKLPHPVGKLINSIIQNISAVAEELGTNLTNDTILSILNTFKSTQFIYDSQIHPSSVTIPTKLSTEDIRTYYLHADQTMSQTQPTGTKGNATKLSKTTKGNWTTNEALERNKLLVLRNTTLEIYLKKSLFLLRPNVQLDVTLYDNVVALASTTKKVTRKDVQLILGNPKKPIVIAFNGSATEIAHGHLLSVSVAVNKNYFFKPTLLYDSTTYPSNLRVQFQDTNNIQVREVTEIPSNGLITPKGSVKYLVNVSSKYADNITIASIEQEKTGAWTVSAPSSISVAANSVTSIPVFLNSTDELKAAYGNTITTVLVVAGTTGIARTTATAEVSREAIRYDIILFNNQTNVTMKKGETKNIYFTLKNNNTGAIDDVDNYTVSAISQNGWEVIPLESIRDVRRGETSKVNEGRIVVKVPENTTLDSDVINVTVTSDSNPSVSKSFTITVNIEPPDLLQSIYNSLSSVAKSLGLTDIFGDYAAVALTALIMIIILFIIIILAFVLTLKDVDIICTERIKEIEPDQQAVFELTLRNPTRKTMSYKVTAKHTADPSQWVITAEPATLQVGGRQKQPVRIIATPAEAIMPKDWTEINVCVQKAGKKKTASIDLMAMIKEGTTLLQIGNVTHWPTDFSPGDRVVTSFSVSNKGTIVARDVTVFFYLNGKQKNKVTATIPAGAVADVQMPWIAVKGKNKVRIRLKEQ
ncbi:MAG TPA: hypothetical protein VMT57_03055 [Candidatus Thermoplasmatota archaeon]|nr:hypothetical protein [Candidatus Thermoplasmatota archaeon]